MTEQKDAVLNHTELRYVKSSHYDLPIATGLLVAMGVLPSDSLSETIIMGELGLDGSIRAVPGVLPAAIFANSKGFGIVCPKVSGPEAAWAGEVTVTAPSTLVELVNHLKGVQILPTPEPKLAEPSAVRSDFAEVKGQENAKRALEIAAAGGHALLMIGPPGSGKSMLASRMPSILPPLSPAEALEISMIASVAGELGQGGVSRERPVRSPHHSASQPALVGGGTRGRPGEVSLAHNGVLFLDELPEFSRSCLEALRQPLESGAAVISRVHAHVTYPASFQLIAAMNPCRCGHLADEARACSRAPLCGADYQAKISGPIYDRIDLFVDVPALTAQELSAPASGEASTQIAERVLRARQRQQARFEDAGASSIHVNAHADGKVLEQILALDKRSEDLIKKAADTYQLSARGYHRVLKVARTIADLDGSMSVASHHVAEALSYRRFETARSFRKAV